MNPYTPKPKTKPNPNPTQNQPNPNPNPSLNPNPNPNPPDPSPRTPRQNKQYKNFGKQKTRQENLNEKFKRQTIVEDYEQVKLLTMNVNSIHGHRKSTLATLSIKESNPDIAILTETKLGPLSNTFRVPGYQIATQTDRKVGAGGIMVLSKLGISVEATSRNLIEEIQVAKVIFKDLTILGVYRSPTVIKKDDKT